MKDAASVVHFVESEVFSCFKQPFVVSDRDLRVSVKAGIAMFPVDGENADILFRNAESALKRVRASSDRYLFYATDMNAQAAHAIAMETRLRKAVDASNSGCIPTQDRTQDGPDLRSRGADPLERSATGLARP